jgi:hypothetical protein
MRSLKMKLSRGNIILCKVPMPSEALRKFKLRPGLIVSKDLNKSMIIKVIGKLSENGIRIVNECLKDALALEAIY